MGDKLANLLYSQSVWLYCVVMAILIAVAIIMTTYLIIQKTKERKARKEQDNELTRYRRKRGRK